MQFIFYGKILGFYYELDATNTRAKENSEITPATTVKGFKQNAKKAYPHQKIIFNKVG